MIIDIAFILFVVLAVLKGIKNGLILGVFSLISIVIGLAAAMKLSAVVAAKIGEATTISQELLPFIAFAAVFIVVIILIRIGAKLIEKVFTLTHTNWANKLAGVILYGAIYIIVLSILIFYAEKLGLISASQTEDSVVYAFIQPWGKMAIDGIAIVLPFFHNMFEELNIFFDKVAQDISVL